MKQIVFGILFSLAQSSVAAPLQSSLESCVAEQSQLLPFNGVIAAGRGVC